MFGRGIAAVDTPVSVRSELAVGARFNGPAVVEERETTSVIRPGWAVEVAADGSLMATRMPPMTATDTPQATFDPIELEILWQSLISTVNEQARALQRSAFSPIVREAGDLANAVFDRRGRMVAQAVTGTPGHINSLRYCASKMLEEYPLDQIEPGDVLITNDPYKPPATT